MSTKKVGILGSGPVGQTLANGFIKYGYEAMIGTRHPEKAIEWRNKAGGKGRVGTFSGAAAFGSILVLAVKGLAAKEALTAAGTINLKGKTIIDVTNPIADSPAEAGVIKFFTSLEMSLMEMLQNDFPQADFVKAFNSIGSAFMVNPDFGGVKPTMFICGNNDQSKKEVAEIVEQFGFETEDMGKANAARAIEPLCMLWCIPGLLRNDWSHAFKFLKK